MTRQDGPLRQLRSRLIAAAWLSAWLVACLMAFFGPGSPLFAQEEPAAGRVIGNITIEIEDIFEQDHPVWLYRQANNWKYATRQRVIRRELLFQEGDPLDQFVLDESLRRLRNLGFLRRARITTQERGDVVDIVVTVQDTWTLYPQLDFMSGGGESQLTLGAKDSNLLGSGKRLELLYDQDEKRESWEGVWEDPRLFGSDKSWLAAYFDRSDGRTWLSRLEKPYRTLLDENAWRVDGMQSDTVGRLFAAGSEKFIYRQENDAFKGFFSWSQGDPEEQLSRITLGYGYEDDRFAPATAEDYRNLDLNPADLLQDPALVPENRRLSGPELGWQLISSEFFSSAQIDRFTRVEDVDLGWELSLSAQAALTEFGSLRDSLPFSANFRRGRRLSQSSFVRGEIGVGGRLEDSGFSNTLLRTEGRWYHLSGRSALAGWTIPGSTWMGALFLDYGFDLDGDRQLQVGSNSTLRGYKARALSGDKRIGFSVENRLQLFENVLDLLHIGSAIFFDAGGATYDNLGTLLTDEIYSSVGLGLRLGFPRSAGENVLRVDLAFPLRPGPDGTEAWEPRLVISGGQLFGAALRSERLGAQKASTAIGFDR